MTTKDLLDTLEKRRRTLWTAICKITEYREKARIDGDEEFESMCTHELYRLSDKYCDVGTAINVIKETMDV